MSKRVYDPVPGDAAVAPISLDHATRMRMSLATHVRVRGGIRWADALTATCRDFYTRWFPRS